VVAFSLNSLGRNAEALEVLQGSVATAEALVADNPTNIPDLEALANVRNAVGIQQFALGHVADALASMEAGAEAAGLDTARGTAGPSSAFTLGQRPGDHLGRFSIPVRVRAWTNCPGDLPDGHPGVSRISVNLRARYSSQESECRARGRVIASAQIPAMRFLDVVGERLDREAGWNVAPTPTGARSYGGRPGRRHGDFGGPHRCFQWPYRSSSDS
jgi:hypothetical protein